MGTFYNPRSQIILICKFPQVLSFVAGQMLLLMQGKMAGLGVFSSHQGDHSSWSLHIQARTNQAHDWSLKSFA
uniref:Uncharacterized protein n=1 Tax=Arundo donax TaxID=35708 RepID=A0A0A8YKW4_ARUDO